MLSPLPREIIMRTGHLLAARAAGYEPVTVDIRGNKATNGEYLFPIANGILGMGGEAYLNLGKPNNGGTKLFSVSGHVNRSVLFSTVRVHSYAEVNWSVLLHRVSVGRRARLTRVVVDSGCTIPEGMIIGEDAEEDARRFYRSETGITLVTAEMLRKIQA